MLPADIAAARGVWEVALPPSRDPADLPEGVARFLARNPGTCFVAEENGRVVGTVLGGDDGRRGYVHHLAVVPELRGRGIGSALLKEMERAMAARGIAKVHLFVFEDNGRAHALYEREGWEHRTDIRIYSRRVGGS